MQKTIQQAYRHLVQQQIIRQMMLSRNTQSSRGDSSRGKSGGWETSGIFALFSAAVVCGTLAQLHLG